MKRRRLLEILAAASFLGAWPHHPRAGSARDSFAAVFGTVPEPTRISRVFAAGGPAAVLVSVLAPEKLLGWPMPLGAQARALLAEEPGKLPQLGRLSGKQSTISTESLLLLQPDLILDAGTVSPLFVSGCERIRQQTGLPCVLVDGKLSDHPAQLRKVGQLLGVAQRGEMLATYTEQLFALVATVLAQVPLEERPSVYYARGIDGLETGLEGSINMEVIEFVGARNVAAAAGRGGLAQVSMEQLLDWDPQVILTQELALVTRLRTDPLWRNMAAVRAGRVHRVPALPFGWLDTPPGVNRLIGVRWLLSLLYPDRHPSLSRDETRTAVAGFHRLFHGVELSQGDLGRLLADAA